MKIAISAGFFAKWDMDVNSGHVAKLWLKFKIAAAKNRDQKLLQIYVDEVFVR
jgi:hypothetical protein